MLLATKNLLEFFILFVSLEICLQLCVAFFTLLRSILALLCGVTALTFLGRELCCDTNL